MVMVQVVEVHHRMDEAVAPILPTRNEELLVRLPVKFGAGLLVFTQVVWMIPQLLSVKEEKATLSIHTAIIN